MQYKKKTGGGGKWVDKSELTNGQKAKIVTETETVEGQYGSQDACKVRFQGAEESVNVNLNQGTINGLIDAFGDDSKDWINKVLTVQMEKMVIGGKRVTALYLIPEGYVLGEDENGYIEIQKGGAKVVKEVTVDADDDINPEDIPF